MTAYTNIGRRLELVACLLDHEASTGRGMGVISVAYVTSSITSAMTAVTEKATNA